jgi:16S rRNA (cytosine1402-N4)-methyltransferase
MTPGFHDPVMVEEVLEVLETAREGWILDGTLGGGGHTEAMLLRWPECRVLGVDRDPEALERAAERLTPFSERIRYLGMRFDNAMDDAKLNQDGLDGALLDLGVSSWQLDQDHRGFAFRRGVELDMRMGEARASAGASTGASEGASAGTLTGESAAELLNEWPTEELARVFWEYGEEPKSRKLAREVVRRRADRPFRSSDDLVAALAGTLGRAPGQSEKARIFQALRIAVNEELHSLTQALPLIRDALNPGGVLAVIAYHSLEDRIVKNALREWSQSCVCPPGLPICVCRGKAYGAPVFKGLRRPSEAEVDENPRARSALLRAWRKAS